MKTRALAPKRATALRRQAKSKIKQKQDLPGLLESETEVRRLLQELQVHEIELELQNEELNQAALAARESAEKYTELYDFAPIGYFSLDRSGAITEANLAAASMLGLQRSRLVKRRFESFVPIADQPAFRALFAQVFDRGPIVHSEMTLKPCNGGAIDVRWDSIATNSGSHCRVAIVDISAEKRAGRDRLILRQLESLGVLAGGIAHDFNNLLAVILMSIEVAKLQPEPTGGSATSYLDEAIQAVFHAQGLTRKFISLSNGISPAHEPVALPALIRESVRSVLADSVVQVEFAVPDDLWTVNVDEGQFSQVIQNVVLNAREAMPEGGIVRVCAHNVALGAAQEVSLPEGNYVCLSVADSGEGIVEENLPRIFEPYYSTKALGTQKGMGLGLTISLAIMKRHKGAISAESEAGLGTTFHLYFPVSPEA